MTDLQRMINMFTDFSIEYQLNDTYKEINVKNARTGNIALWKVYATIILTQQGCFINFYFDRDGVYITMEITQ
jgi:hypothetical protein